MRRRVQPLILRPTTPHDFAEVQALFPHPAFEGWGGPGYRSDAQLREKYLGARLPQVECFLIEADDRVAGFTQLYADGSGGGTDLILLPSERGKGLGRQVVEAMLTRLRASGRTHFVVDPSCVLPGGGVEECEDLRAACRRELLEETGLDGPVGDCSTFLSTAIRLPAYFVVRPQTCRSGARNCNAPRRATSTSRTGSPRHRSTMCTSCPTKRDKRYTSS